MKKIITLAAAAMVMVGGSAFADQGPPASISAGVTADIRAPIAITKQQDLDFGRIVAGYPSGIKVGLLDDRSGDTSHGLSGGIVKSAAFTVTGENVAYNVVAANDTGTGILLADFVYTPTASRNIASNTAQLRVGATLPTGLTAGVKTGSFTVTVVYN